jgi:hypothetical protein
MILSACKINIRIAYSETRDPFMKTDAMETCDMSIREREAMGKLALFLKGTLSPSCRSVHHSHEVVVIPTHGIMHRAA